MRTKWFQRSCLALSLGALLWSATAFAAVSAEEAAKLKTTLTPFGAERAGNKDGTIPAWDGGMTKAPAGYRNGDKRPDFFAGEKPVLSITGKNMAQYKDKLAGGVQYLLKKYPNYRLDIYPTHRSAGAPQWVYDNTFRNATQAQLTASGEGIKNAYGGIPFPIPKNAHEVLMNHRLAWGYETLAVPNKVMVVTADGNLALATENTIYMGRPYYYKGGSVATWNGGSVYFRMDTTGPASKAGEGTLDQEIGDESRPRGVWQYLVGQRRVRKAPSISYDTPDFITSGIGLFDEAFMLNGPLDRHETKLIGKKEMYIPYNNNRAASTKFADLMKPGYLNPDLVRWELHRVWVVEAILKPGKRHVVPKRLYYLDEDTWKISLTDGWDARGDISRLDYALTLLCPDIPALVSDVLWGAYDLQTGSYLLNIAPNESPKQLEVVPNFPDRFWSPEELANRGAR